MRTILFVTATCVALLVGASLASARSQWANEGMASSQYGDSAWSANMAAGPPDVTTCGDNGNAWATAKAGSRGFIDTYYTYPVTASGIWIYQTYNPGGVTKVTVYNAEITKSRVVYTAKATAGGKCPAILKIAVKDVPFPVSIVRTNIDQKVSNSWTEIDAVRLIGKDI